MKKRTTRRWPDKLSEGIVRLWNKDKKILEVILSHSVRTVGLLLAFQVSHTIVKNTNWPEEFKIAADSIHVYAYKITLAIFAVDFILSILKLSFVMTVIQASFRPISRALKFSYQVIYEKIARRQVKSQKDEISKIKDQL